MLTYMIPSIEPIAEYNPFLHRKPIVWFKSRLLSVLKMGSLGETVQSATTTPNYPPQSIVIKVARGYQNKTNNINEIGLVQIYFVGDFISNGYMAMVVHARNSSAYSSGVPAITKQTKLTP